MMVQPLLNIILVPPKYLQLLLIPKNTCLQHVFRYWKTGWVLMINIADPAEEHDKISDLSAGKINNKPSND